MSEKVIEIKNATIAIKYHLVLTEVTFEIRKGEIVYLIGETGSGKTTLLRTLYGDLPLHSGECIVAGYNLNTIKNKEIPYLRRKLGIVFQDFQLLSDRSANDNLLFVLKATGWKDSVLMKERINEVLTKVGLSTKGHKFPHELSGGEQQRLSIARALMNKPEIILADEPTGNLDPDTSEGIMNLLFDIASSGTAVLMATHNYNLIQKFPSRTLKCSQGKIVELKNDGEDSNTKQQQSEESSVSSENNE